VQHQFLEPKNSQRNHREPEQEVLPRSSSMGVIMSFTEKGGMRFTFPPYRLKKVD
jgi:hypothetical protein